MTNDQYLNLLLLKYAVDENAAKLASQRVMPVINQWGNENIVKTVYSGSVAKGTAISLGTDADIFISLSSKTPGTLQTIYNSLYDTLNRAGYRARIQNVSIGININNQKIDIVPARKHDQYTNDHSLYKSKTKTWTKTDIYKHINSVIGSNRTNEIKLIKIWRERHNLDFPSFYLELVTIDALKHSRNDSITINFFKTLSFIAESIKNKKYVDPANTNNIISDELSNKEKSLICNQAQLSFKQQTLDRIIW